MYQVIFYETSRGDCPVQDFLDELEKKPRAKILKFIGHLERLGPDLPRPYADGIRDKIRELRIPYGRRQWRFLYFFDGERVVMTQGFLKKTWAVPEEEIERALRRMEDWFCRGGNA